MMKNIFPAGQCDSFLVPLIEIINFQNNHAYYSKRVPQRAPRLTHPIEQDQLAVAAARLTRGFGASGNLY